MSRSTASRAINGGLKVSPAAQAAVDAAIAELDYTPNRAARSLVTRRTDSVALVVPEEVVRLGLVGDERVGHGEHLIHQEHLRLEGNGDGEAEAQRHARGVGAHRHIDEVAELRKLDDGVVPLAHRRRRIPHQGGAQIDVVAPAQLRTEAGRQLEEAAHTPAHDDAPARRPEDAGDQPQQRALARAVVPDKPDRLACVYRQVEILECPERMRGKRAQQARDQPLHAR